MSLAEKVRVKREELRLTQQELAKKAGLTQATISRIEHGEVRQIRSDAAAALAKALNVTADFLLGKQERMEFEDSLVADPTAQVLFRGYENLSPERKRALLEYVDHMVKMQKSEDKSKK
jgi:transcriptional regulator with XRE-family HTH domain